MYSFSAFPRNTLSLPELVFTLSQHSETLQQAHAVTYYYSSESQLGSWQKPSHDGHSGKLMSVSVHLHSSSEFNLNDVLCSTLASES